VSSTTTTSHSVRLFVLIVSMIFIGADFDASAQNTNSSTTMQEDTSMQNSNTTNMNRTRSRGRRRRRGRRSGSNMGTPNNTPACGPMQDNTSMAGDEAQANTSAGSMNQTPVRTGRCDPMAQVQTDLSGTYTGTTNYAEGGLSGDTTLTISGNKFTMTSGSTTQEGRVVAVTTCNYTAVTMMFGKEQVSAASGPQPAPLPAVSLRAEKVGGGLSLQSTEGETRQFSFNPVAVIVGGGSRKVPRRVRSKRAPGGGGAQIPVGIKPPTRL
jgi:hypothetical protein